MFISVEGDERSQSLAPVGFPPTTPGDVQHGYTMPAPVHLKAQVSRSNTGPLHHDHHHPPTTTHHPLLLHETESY